jgi:hypothetical protein
MTANSGRSESRLTSTFLAVRPGSPSASQSGSVVDAVPAVRPVIEVDAVFAIAATLSISHTPSSQLGSPRKTATARMLPLVCTFSVELRGFEPLAPSMRTRLCLSAGVGYCSQMHWLVPVIERFSRL